MADITMCLNDGCPQADNCWRYCAPANEVWQSYADYKNKEDGKCEDFYPFKSDTPRSKELDVVVIQSEASQKTSCYTRFKT